LTLEQKIRFAHSYDKKVRSIILDDF
jgi:hypothetical protein